MSSRPVRVTGFSLIEIAVALLLISMGTLVLASLQISAKRAGHEAQQRSEASALAMDLLERMRANSGVLSEYATAGIGSASGSALSAPIKDCYQAVCGASELSEFDLWQWQQALDGASALRGGFAVGGLVNPFACVTVQGRLVVLEIAWQGFESISTPEAGRGCGVGRYGTEDEQRQLLRVTSFIGRG